MRKLRNLAKVTEYQTQAWKATLTWQPFFPQCNASARARERNPTRLVAAGVKPRYVGKVQLLEYWKLFKLKATVSVRVITGAQCCTQIEQFENTLLKRTFSKM